MDLQTSHQQKKQLTINSQKHTTTNIISCFNNSKVTNIIQKRELRYTVALIVLVISSVLVSRIAGPLDPRRAFSLSFSAPLWSNKEPKPSSSPESCDYSNGRWVKDDENNNNRGDHGGMYDESCPFLDPGFRCRLNGRPDEGFRGWRWKPHGCDLPRFNASDLLERSRNGRIVFAGDSIGRNQWESLLCILWRTVANKSSIYEVHGEPISKHKGFLSMRFADYNATVEYYRAPFLVTIGHPPLNSSKPVVGSVKLARLHWYSKRWLGAQVLVFNDGHWWNNAKTIDMGYYFEENNKVNMSMDVMEAFKRSLQTWKVWALENLDLQRTHIFFRSFSPVHFRNGTWNEGGNCDMNVGPETNYSKLEPDPSNNVIINDVIKQMDHRNRKVRFLNITYLTEFRKDGHPSKYREPGTPLPAPQDCSHWCLPGVPDTWNQILYATLVSNGFRTN